jgi:response regulator RpfG family c-di-GMP phosphodiesterase
LGRFSPAAQISFALRWFVDEGERIKPTLLCVDDDPAMLAHHARTLRKEFNVHTALSGADGLATIEQGGRYPAVLVDMQMPGMDGIAFLKRAAKLSPDSAYVMLTGNIDQLTAVRAVNEGHVFRFLNKPCSAAAVLEAVNAGVVHSRALQANRLLEEKVFDGGIRLLTQVLHAADPHAAQRSQNLLAYLRTYYEALDASNELPRDLEIAASFCFVGFAVIPSTVLRKARTGGDLTPMEERMLESAAELGGNILGFVPQMETAGMVVRYQNKSYAGGGYPRDEVSGDALPFGARLLHVMIDLLRLEGEGSTRSEALLKMQARAGEYDPEILKVCQTRWRPSKHKTLERVRVPVPLAELCISDVLGKALYSVSNIFLAPEGTVISKPLMCKIREWERMEMLNSEVIIFSHRVALPDGLPCRD